jgi:hypothetical protein
MPRKAKSKEHGLGRAAVFILSNLLLDLAGAQARCGREAKRLRSLGLVEEAAEEERYEAGYRELLEYLPDV